MLMKRGTHNVLTGLVYQALSILFGILLPRLFIIGFGSDINGLLSSITQIFTYVGLLEAGIGAATMQALYKPIAIGNKQSISEILAAANHFYKQSGYIYAIAVVLISILYPLVLTAQQEYSTVVAIIAFQGMGGVMNYLFQGKYKLLLEAEGNGYFLNNVSTIIHLLSNLTKIVLIYTGCSIVTVQIAYFLIQLLQMCIICIFIKKRYSWIDLSAKPNTRAIEQKNAVLWHNVAWLVFNNTDVILLTLITKNLVLVSVYTVYLLIFEAVLNVLETVANNVQYALGNAYQQSLKMFNAMYSRYEVLYIGLSFCAFTICYPMVIPFIKLYTSGVVDANYVMVGIPQLFTAIKILSCIRKLGTQVCNVAGMFRTTQHAAIKEAIINMCVSIPGIYFFGIHGALSGTLVALIYRCNQLTLFVSKNIRKKSPVTTYRRIMRNTLLMLLMIILWAKIEWTIYNYGTLIFTAICIGLITIITFSIINLLFERDLCKEIVQHLSIQKQTRRHTD